jgi:hypothetical protein
VYGEHALSRSEVFKWDKAFSEGHESIKSKNISKKLKLILKNTIIYKTLAYA